MADVDVTKPVGTDPRTGRPVYSFDKKPPEVPVVTIVKREEFLDRLEGVSNNVDTMLDQLERWELDLRYYVIELKSLRNSLEAMIAMEKRS